MKGIEWVTVYIRGRAGAESEVLKNLDHRGFRYMRGHSTERGLGLYWIPKTVALREFKKAIGSKTIFRYRLRFFTNVEEFVESRHNPKSIVFEQ